MTPSEGTQGTGLPGGDSPDPWATPPAPTPAAEAAPTADLAPAPKRRRFRFLPPLRSKRGLLIVFLLVAGFGSITTVGGVVAIQWTETADFCGRCHTMGPELKAFANSPHAEFTCAECHVEPGVQGWIKAKINGTRQLVMILTGTFPKPIPAPDHADLPPVATSCQKCHSLNSITANGGPVRLVIRNNYADDETNSKSSVALVIRPSGFGGNTEMKGVHWHVVSDVEYLRSDSRAQKIDYVKVTEENGDVEEFLAASAVSVPEDVTPDIEALKARETQRRMDCIDCHNRVGHGIPSIEDSVDSAIDRGDISSDLPYVKREAVARLSIAYASEADAAIAFGKLRDFYATRYPLIAESDAQQINATIDALKTIYPLVATPDMRVTAATYPNNLGHQTAPGCFRCHDGAHYKVENGALTEETIPSACATCHTFPQIGAQTSGVLIGERPVSHSDRLWVFSHKTAISKVDPTGTDCAACHTPSYCLNCHKTKAVQVPHDNMVMNHANVIERVGAQACTLCHQRPYCAQCHTEQVLPAGPSDNGGVPTDEESTEDTQGTIAPPPVQAFRYGLTW